MQVSFGVGGIIPSTIPRLSCGLLLVSVLLLRGEVEDALTHVLRRGRREAPTAHLWHECAQTSTSSSCFGGILLLSLG